MNCFAVFDNVNTYIALWDTGSVKTVIKKRVVDELQLNHISNAVISTIINDSNNVKTYNMNMVLPNHSRFISLEVVCFDHTKPYDIIIGMDLISQGRFELFNGKLSFEIKELK